MGVKHTKSTYTFNKEMKMKVLCECNSFKGCRQTTDLSIETLTSIRNIKDSVIKKSQKTSPTREGVP